MLIAWLQDSRAAPRALRRAARPLDRRGDAGRRPRSPRLRLHLVARGTPSRHVAGERAVLEVRGAQTTGLDGGAWCADGHSDDLPFDQRADDGRSLCFDSPPLRGAARAARARARRSHADQRPPARARRASASASCCPAAPRCMVTRGQLNLTHREGHDRAVPLVPGEPVAVACRWTPSPTASRPARGCASRSRRPTGRWPGRRPRRSRSASSPSESTIALPLHDAAAAPARAAAVPARGAAGLPDDRARARARRAHDHARARHRPHRAALRLGSRRHEPRRRHRAPRSRSRPMRSSRSSRTSRSRRGSSARTRRR